MVQEGEQVVAFDVSSSTAMLKGIEDKIVMQRGDILDLPSVLRTIKDRSVDKIVHIGAMTKVDSDENPFQSFKVNGEGTMNLFEASRILGVKRFVLMSSLDLYGEKPSSEVITEHTQVDPVGMIGIMKYAAENCGIFYSRAYGLDFVALRFTAIFGPGKTLASRHTELTIEGALDNASRGKSVSISTSSKDLLYIRDAANALYLAWSKKLESRIYNVGAGKLTTAQDIAAAIHSIFPQIEVKHHDTGEKSMLMSIEKARRELGYSIEYPLEKAFRDYLEHQRKAA
jgi:nucleoside-diphosphate-sugar epimerase